MPIEEDDGNLRVQTREAVIRSAQKYFAQFDDGKNWSAELIRERRAEARQEGRR